MGSNENKYSGISGIHIYPTKKNSAPSVKRFGLPSLVKDETHHTAVVLSSQTSNISTSSSNSGGSILPRLKGSSCSNNQNYSKNYAVHRKKS